jgi:hypothetical protein
MHFTMYVHASRPASFSQFGLVNLLIEKTPQRVMDIEGVAHDHPVNGMEPFLVNFLQTETTFNRHYSFPQMILLSIILLLVLELFNDFAVNDFAAGSRAVQ